jgi:hypothetical protein
MNKKRVKRRRVLLFSAALIIIPGSLGYIEFFLSRPIGEGPAGPSVQSRNFRHVWSERKVQVVGIGDSITSPVAGSTPTMS